VEPQQDFGRSGRIRRRRERFGSPTKTRVVMRSAAMQSASRSMTD
jgi:hypothetical protein